jgi:hypothetical protein
VVNNHLKDGDSSRPAQAKKLVRPCFKTQVHVCNSSYLGGSGRRVVVLGWPQAEV